jgi:hypothetical protein
MTTHRVDYQYATDATRDVAAFADAFRANAAGAGGTFDSAASGDFLSGIENSATSGVKLPEKLGTLFEELDADGKASVGKAIFDGIGLHEAEHGAAPPADLVEQAIHAAYSTSRDARKRFVLDSATNLASDKQSLQPNRAIVAIYAVLAEACPFAHYLPADIGSNEARLAILSHTAGSEYGRYKQGDILNGINGGDAYIYSARIHKAAIDGAGVCTGKLTAQQDTDIACKADGAAVKLVRGSARVYIGGQIVARETEANTGANSTISGSWTSAAGVAYNIGGYIQPDSGGFQLTTTPAIPNAVEVLVESFIDYERVPDLIPSVDTAVEIYKLFAREWRVKTKTGIGSRTQMSNELGLDPYSESVMAIQQQFTQERHYRALAMARRLAASNQRTYDFNWPIFGQQKTRWQIWLDATAHIGAISLQMAIDTMNHGVTHLYVGKNLKAQFEALPSDIFAPSGIAERPGIYRLGRLFNKYDVYYTPKHVVEAADGTAAEILCAGRATDVTRNPVVFGDAVAPIVQPLPYTDDLKTGAAFYARNFTEINPHKPSSLGFGLIEVTNLQ